MHASPEDVPFGHVDDTVVGRVVMAVVGIVVVCSQPNRISAAKQSMQSRT